MPKPKRNLHAVAAETQTPPDALTATQTLARVHSAAGNNLYRLLLPSVVGDNPASATALPADDARLLLAELPARFRNTIWIKRGSVVLVDTAARAERANKLGGEIVNIVRDEKRWRKMPYWPGEFAAKAGEKGNRERRWDEGSDDSEESEEDRGPQMPESEDEGDGEDEK